MAQLLVGVNIFLIFALWVFVLRKSILDHHRDKLFDLRDEVRNHFVQQGWDLGSPLYRHLRDLLNCHLRFTEQYTFTQFVLMEGALRDNEAARYWLKQRVEKHLTGTNPEQQKFVKDVRQRAVQILMSYMVVSSGPLAIATAVVFPVFFCVSIGHVFVRVCSVGSKRVNLTISAAKRVLSGIVFASSSKVGGAIFKEDFIEGCSYTSAFSSEAIA